MPARCVNGGNGPHSHSAGRRTPRESNPVAVERLEGRTLLAAGLEGSYFPNKTLSGEPVLRRRDLGQNQSQFQYDWGLSGPALIPGNPTDNFSVRWRGAFRTPFAGNYTFFIGSDNGSRLFLNNSPTPAADGWSDHLYQEFATAPMTLTAGQLVPLRLEYYESTGPARINLMYSGPGIVKQTIQSSNLVVAPQVTSVVFDGPVTPYTSKSHLEIKFSDNVAASFNADDIELRHLEDDYIITNEGNTFAINYNQTTNTAIVTFPGLIGEQLDDGNYELRLKGSGINDTTGTRLDGNADEIGGDDFTTIFYRLTGDTQMATSGQPRPDRKVDFADYQILARNFTRYDASGNPLDRNKTPRQGDLNYDGIVDYIDFDILKGLPFDPAFPGTFGNTLPDPPQPAAPVASAPAPQPAPIITAPVAKRPVSQAKPLAKPAAVTAVPPRFAAKRIKDTGNWLASA